MSLARALTHALLAAAAISPAAAQLSWVLNPATGHRYALTPSAMTWAQAEQLAVAQGGHLATVRSQAENDWLVQTFGGSAFHWIGLSDHQQEGTWVWSSGEPVTFTNWCTGEPSGGLANEDFAEIVPVSYPCVSGKWNDDLATENRVGIIEVVPPAASFTAYRQSCASSAGLPSLTNTSLPVVGSTLTLEVVQLGAHKPGALLIGFDDRIWQALPLPFDLAAIGAPACWLNIDPSVDLVGFSDNAGIARLAISIPQDPAHLGLTFFTQYVSLGDAPSSRGLQITTTNAGKAVIGR